MRSAVARANALTLPLGDNTADLIVTSPPYWALRSYTDDGGKRFLGQIGSEATPQEWVEVMVACTAEWLRVLKPSGSIFVNLGDKFSTGASGQSNLAEFSKTMAGGGHSDARAKKRTSAAAGFLPKSLLFLPHRYAIACVDQLNIIPRQDLVSAELDYPGDAYVWSKPNGLPESARDRCRRSHEYVFHFVKSQRYFSAVDEIREPFTGGAHPRRKDGRLSPKQSATVEAGHRQGFIVGDDANPLGRTPGSVWTIASQPLNLPDWLGVEHYAAFPMELPRRIIQGWSPAGICVECGEGRRPVSQVTHEPTGRTNSGRAKRQTADGTLLSRGFNSAGYPHTIRTAQTLGYVCACTPYTDHPERRRPSVTTTRELRNDQDERERLGLARHHGDDWPERQPIRDYHLGGWLPPPVRPAVVVDPFGGTGTTALVAAALGRLGVSFDLSLDYCRAAVWRTNDRSEIAKAMQVRKPPAVPGERDGQYGLFDLSDLERSDGI